MILGWWFLTTSNALIDCRHGKMNLNFGNMTTELNMFNLRKQPLGFSWCEAFYLKIMYVIFLWKKKNLIVKELMIGVYLSFCTKYKPLELMTHLYLIINVRTCCILLFFYPSPLPNLYLMRHFLVHLHINLLNWSPFSIPSNMLCWVWMSTFLW